MTAVNSRSARRVRRSGWWEDAYVSTRPILRVRKSGAVLIAAGIAIVGAIPLAGASRALAPVVLIPIAVFLWAWRAGTDVYPDQIRVRALVGGSRVPWSRVVELAPDRRGRVSALLDNGNVLRLTGVTRDNLPMVLAATGRPITPGTAAEPSSSAASTGEPSADLSAADPSAAESPAAEPSAGEPSPGGQPAGERRAGPPPAPDRADDERPATDRPATDR